ncbi:hypothetical protein X474_18240 [Dethiosulfatarculus sandiegensis]|uniref:histidine kinase n=2 Tax=Dethiosulfatarculus sandiegensis TaxID=1429043 RepID=A0A0D2J302_9BACT|nr:hypothetical protein X474_18240 [Dethiosulfatarculus sandiegensis]
MVRNFYTVKMLITVYLAAVFLSVGSLGSYWIYREYSDFKLQSRELKQMLLAEHKNQIKVEVEKAAGFVEFTKRRMYKRLMRELRYKVYLAHGVAESIYQEQKDPAHLQETMALVKRILSRIRFWNEDCYYFAGDSSGRVERFLRPDKIVHGTIDNLFTSKSLEYVKEMTTLAQNGKEGYHQYELIDPGSDAPPRTKLSFLKNFKPFNWYLGTGEYLDQATERIQTEVIKGLEKVILPPGGYLFLGDFKGKTLMGSFAPENMWTFKTPENSQVVERLIQVARQGGGFVQYTMFSEDNPGRPRQKISYVLPIKNWDWFVGTGFFTDEIDLKLVHRQKRLTKQIKAKIANILVFVFLATFFIYLFWLFVSNRLSKELAVFQSFFAQAATKRKPIDLEKLKSREFKDLACLANQMLAQRKKAEAEKANMERQLSRAKKMEAIGTLAGGIAHDFNNILGGIMGYAELAQNKLPRAGHGTVELGKIISAAERAGVLVRRILTFSRKHNTQYEPLDLNQVIRRAMELLSCSLPKMLQIELILAKERPCIMGDANELEQVIMNLASNAKDAMPMGGCLSIITSLVSIPGKLPDQGTRKTKTPFVRLTVSDTGCGISKDHLEQIYDPFFTTKGVGKGTGLGLSTVMGIIENHNGWVECKSALKRGTEFTIYLPRCPEEMLLPAKKSLESGGEVQAEKAGYILVVDDEKALRETTGQLLKYKGYRVATAGSGEEALEAFDHSEIPFDLVILDVSMPGMGGNRCLTELRARDPELKVLLMSGYALQGSLAELKKKAAGFLAKPVRAAQILEAVQEALLSKN